MLKNCCTTLILVLLCVVPAYAVDRYVAKTGNDANSCTIASPCLTIARGLTVMSGGEILRVRVGTYQERELIMNKSGTAGAHTTLRSFEGDIVTISWPFAFDGDNKSMIHSGNTTNYTTIDGLRLDLRTNTGSRGLGFGVTKDAGTNLTIKNSEIFGAIASGLLLTNVSNIILENNIVRENGSDLDLDHGIYLSGSNHIVRRNTVRNNRAYNMQCYFFCNGVTVIGNTFTGSRLGFSFNNGSNNFFISNLMYDDSTSDPSSGLNILNDDSVKIFNNTFYNTGISIRNDSGGSIEFRNNIRAGGAAFTDSSGNAVSSTNFIGNPGFVNQGARDFHLLSSATSAINQGTPLASVILDFDGDVRPHGGGLDLGADEFVTGTELPRHLAFTNNSSDAVVGVFVTPPLVVEVHFPDHSVDTSSTDTLTLALVVCGGTMTCGAGTCTRDAVAGVVTYSEILFDTPGTNCQHSLSATFDLGGGSDFELSDTFNIAPAPGPPVSGDRVRIKGRTGFFFK